MKFLPVAAVLVLACSPLFSAEVVPGRGELLQEMETWRAMHLSGRTDQRRLVFASRLRSLQDRVEPARTTEELAAPKGDFEAWKSDLLGEEFAEGRLSGRVGGLDLLAFTQTRTLSAELMNSIRTQIQRSAGGSSRVFDGTGARDSAVVPAGYDDARRMMISQGAAPRIVDAAIQEALRQGVDPRLVLPLIRQESRFHAGARSSANARGLMQLTPETGRDMGVSDAGMLYDVSTNLRAGIRYLRWVARYLRLNVDLSDVSLIPMHKIRALLASYNAGIGNVARWLYRQGGELTRIPFAETRHYVRVIGDDLARLLGAP